MVVTGTELVAALYGSSLVGESGSYDTIHATGRVENYLSLITGSLERVLQALGVSLERERANNHAVVLQTGTAYKCNILGTYIGIVYIVNYGSLRSRFLHDGSYHRSLSLGLGSHLLFLGPCLIVCLLECAILA